MSQQSSQLVVFGPIDPDVCQRALDSIPPRSKETHRGHVDCTEARLNALESSTRDEIAQRSFVAPLRPLNAEDQASIPAKTATRVSEQTQKPSQDIETCLTASLESPRGLIESDLPCGGSGSAGSVGETNEFCDAFIDDDNHKISGSFQHEIPGDPGYSPPRSRMRTRKPVQYHIRRKSLNSTDSFQSSQCEHMKERPSIAGRKKRRLPSPNRLPLILAGAEVALRVE